MSSTTLLLYPGLRSRLFIQETTYIHHETDNETKEVAFKNELTKIHPSTVALILECDLFEFITIKKEMFDHLPHLKIIYFNSVDNMHIESLPETIEVILENEFVTYSHDSDFSCYTRLNLPNLKYIRTSAHFGQIIPSTVTHFEYAIPEGIQIDDFIGDFARVSSTHQCTLSIAYDYNTSGMITKFFAPYHFERLPEHTEHTEYTEY